MKNKLVVPFLSKAVNISMILLMIVTLMNTRAVRVVQAAYNPSFSARLTENQVHGYEWNLGDSVTLTIDDPDNGVSNDFTDTQTVVVADWDPTMTFVLFDLGGFVLEPGQEVSMADGTTTKTHTVRDLAVTAVDPAADTVSGTAEPGSEVTVGPVCDKSTCAFRRVSADSSGNWVAEFSVVGEDPDEQDLFDIVPGTSSEANQRDADGDNTMAGWRVPNPYIQASPAGNWVNGFDWPVGASLTLTIDDPSNGAGVDKTATATVGPAPWNPNENLAQFDLEGFDLQPGHLLEVTDGTTTRTMTPTNLAVTGIDLTADTITGMGDPALEVQACVNATDRCYARYTTPSGGGAWTVDYAHTGPRDDEKDLVDLQPGNDGWAAQFDANGNQTWFDWRIPRPFIQANLTGNWVHAYDWPTGASLTLTIDDPSNGTGVDSTATATVGPAPWNPNDILADFNLAGFDLQPGHLLEVTDGTTSRTMTTINLAVTSFDLDAETITGAGDPDLEVQVCVNATDRCFPRYTTSGGSGAWSVDYAHTGLRDDEQDLVDLQPGTDGWAVQFDANGNQTQIDWRIANPWLQANPLAEWVQAREWSVGTTLTLTIDDPADGEDIDYTATGVVGPAPWDPNDIVAHFDLVGFDLQPGHIIRVTDGTTARTMTPTDLAVTGIDLTADTITGVGDPTLEVHVCVNFVDGCYARYTTPSGGGGWSVDYASAGPRDDEKDLVNLRAGSNGWAAQGDGHGNQTWIDWWLPNPYISDIADQTINEDTSTGAIPFMIDDAGVPLDVLTITAESSNTVLAPVANISFGGSGANRTISIEPASGQYGSATITVTVGNGSQSSSDTFVLTVNAVNDPPSVALASKTTSLPENTNTASAIKVADIVVTDDNLGTNTLALSGADAALFQIVGSELRLKAATVLDYETKPVLNVTVEVNDAALSGDPEDSDTLTINITDVNEAPVITEGETVTVTMSQSGKLQPFSLTLHATDQDQNSTLTWSIATLAQHGTATVSGTGTSKAISYTPASDYFGADSFVVEVSDGNGGVDTITVNVTITKVNQVFLPIVVK